MKRSVWVVIVTVALACQKTTPGPTPPPAAAPAAVTETAPPPAPPPPPVPAPTLDDARKLKDKPAEYETALLALSNSSDAKTQGRALALLGLLYEQQKQSGSAIKALATAADLDAIVAPWLRLRVAELQRAAGTNDDAAATLRRIVQETPASSAATTARIRLAALVPDAFADTASIAIDAFTEPEFVKLAKARPDV